MALWMLRYAQSLQQQPQQQPQQLGAAPDVAAAEARLQVDGDAVGALLALCGPMAPLLLLPYAAQGGVTALLQPLALRRLLCAAAGFDLGGGAGLVSQRAQVMAAAKSALLAGQWADAVDICRASHDGSSDQAVAMHADLQAFAVRRCAASIVRSVLADGMHCEPEALSRAFRARTAGSDAAMVFALCHRQLSSAILEQRVEDLVLGGLDESSARHEATVAAGWEAAVQLCLAGLPSCPRPALCDPRVQELLMRMATAHAGHREFRMGELIAAAATYAATLSDAQLLRQVLHGARFALTISGEGGKLPRALAEAVCRLTGNDGAGREGWGTADCWECDLPLLAPGALFAALDEIWEEARGKGVAVEVLQAVVATLVSPSEAAPQHATLSMAGRAWLAPRLARAGLQLDAQCAPPNSDALQRQLAGCWLGLGAAGGEEQAEDMAYAYFAAVHEHFGWSAQGLQSQRLQLAVMRAVRRGTALDVRNALSEQWALQSQVGGRIP
ncbi:hypothetical protein MNEG_6553 [Monoraphidium neglectum]|uniref:Uncharacterized protein n=1 Tax=Monoraphidium neglectum TaxID=145388 RepID=A0A0D2N626_9CHLO|nr:hypothetical protein MNEG_6553 [Monoraphidium neglectum]KIZ01411.1 hypothetical protein MNEG_6553 [Monoraphidium neglectum]|eukprot:XP_013900430.1 hypothetical protein MNEG_6553 [Monoraphidium neglectum]